MWILQTQNKALLSLAFKGPGCWHIFQSKCHPYPRTHSDLPLRERHIRRWGRKETLFIQQNSSPAIPSVAGWIMAPLPKDVHVITLRTHDCVTSHGKRGYLWVEMWPGTLAYACGPNAITGSLEERRRRVRARGDSWPRKHKRERDVGQARGERWRLLEAEEARKQALPWNLQKGPPRPTTWF